MLAELLNPSEMLHYYPIFRYSPVVDLHVFNNLVVMLLKSPFFLAPQGMSRTCKSKLFHNSTRATLAYIDAEITQIFASMYVFLSHILGCLDLKNRHFKHIPQLIPTISCFFLLVIPCQ